jgi:hypothetical protein
MNGRRSDTARRAHRLFAKCAVVYRPAAGAGDMQSNMTRKKIERVDGGARLSSPFQVTCTPFVLRSRQFRVRLLRPYFDRHVHVAQVVHLRSQDAPEQDHGCGLAQVIAAVVDLVRAKAGLRARPTPDPTGWEGS